MKITDQTIPPELAALYTKLISRKPTLAGTEFVARTKPAALKKAPTRPKRKQLRDIEAAVDFLIEYITTSTGTAPAAGFRAAQIASIKAGTFDTTYWTQCAQASSTTLQNAPTSGAFVGIRNYAYPDALNQPSTPTYGAGTAATGDPSYTGSTTSSVFRDTNLRWLRVIFTLANSFTRGQPEPLFLKLTGTITASANARPSRAMISAIIKRWIVAAGSTRLTTTEAPVIKPISALWRYKTPSGVAPYFALTKPLQLLYAARSLDYEEAAGTLTNAIVLVAPMPMLGKRYNNNTNVSSTITATLECWQIKKESPITLVGYGNYQGGTWAFSWSTNETKKLNAPTNYISTLALSCNTTGSTIAGYGFTADVNNWAIKWLNGEVEILTKPPTVTSSIATKVSGNGTMILGDCYIDGSARSITWQGLSTNILPTLSGGSTTTATDISADGTTIVGSGNDTNNELLPIVWQAGVASMLPMLDLGTYAYATAISSDGLTIAINGDDEFGYENTYLIIDGGNPQIIADGDAQPTMNVSSISANGSVLTGYVIVAGKERAFIWTDNNGLTLLPLPTNSTKSLATAISEDGLQITGNGLSVNTAWLWDVTNGTELLTNTTGWTNLIPRGITTQP